MKIGQKVRTPDTHNGVVCDVSADGTVTVMWGDNNRKRYTAQQANGFEVQP